MTTIQSFMIAAVLAVGVGALPVQAEDAAAVNEVLQLKDAGLAEETIVTFIRSQNKNYSLSAENVLVLREQGVSVAVMNAMLESGKTAVDPLPVPAPVYASQPAIVPQPAFDQDAAFFHQELSPYGQWILGEENQWCWQPTVAVGHPDWRPYWDRGRWVYTDHGWYWSSDYPWGWAAFHYGRWNLHPRHGWIWHPDREWAPAWVTWRMGGDYCGWAPLPQYSRFDNSAGGLSFHGRPVEASFNFGLAWNQFNFSYLREMGDRPRARFRKEADARNIYNQTSVINNYTISRNTVNNENPPRIFNHGIDPGRVAALRGKPVVTVQILDRRMQSPSRAPERVDARAKTLEVYRPRLAEPSQPLRGLPVAGPVPRPNGPPSQDERGRAQPMISRDSPNAAPSAGPRSLSPNSPMTPGPRPGGPPSQDERGRAQPMISRDSPNAAPSAGPRSLSPNSQMTPGTRPGGPPSQDERGRAQPAITRSSPNAAPSAGPRSLSPNSPMTPGTRPNGPPPQGERGKMQPSIRRESPTNAASSSRSLPAKPPKESK